MVGQVNLLKKLHNYNIDTFPRSTIILGEQGSGKHLIASYIAKEIINLPLIDITDFISDEYIDAIYRNPNPIVYMIDMTKFLFEKGQNILLKFIEEPLKNAFIILLAENKTNVLETVFNRCISFEMDKYSNEELSQFLESGEDPDLALSVLTTPGQILNNNLSTLMEMKDVCDKICSKLSQANLSNTLTISDKINYSDQFNKFDFNIFMNMLLLTLMHSYLATSDKNTLEMYLLVVDEKKKLVDKRLNKEYFMQHLLTRMWKLVKKN